MATISKKEIVKTVSERHGLTTTQTGQSIQVFMDQIIDELESGNRIEFRECGIFRPKPRQHRIARNTTTGEAVEVPGGLMAGFRAAPRRGPRGPRPVAVLGAVLDGKLAPSARRLGQGLRGTMGVDPDLSEVKRLARRFKDGRTVTAAELYPPSQNS